MQKKLEPFFSPVNKLDPYSPRFFRETDDLDKVAKHNFLLIINLKTFDVTAEIQFLGKLSTSSKQTWIKLLTKIFLGNMSSAV